MFILHLQDMILTFVSTFKFTPAQDCLQLHLELSLDSHPNPLIEPLVHPPNNRRLKRRGTFDEIH